MDQARRRLLTGAGAAAIAGLAGCASANAAMPVAVQGTHFQRSAKGKLLVSTTISNPSNERASVSLTVTAKLSKRTLKRETTLTIDAHKTVLVDLVFDVPWKEASKNLTVHATVKPD